MKATSGFAIVLVLALAGCTSTTPTLQAGDDVETTYDGLVRVDNTIMDSVWARPDIDLKGYSKVIFVPVGISYRDVEPSDPTSALRQSTRSRDTPLREFQLDEETKAFFEAEIGDAFMGAVSSSQVFTIVEEAGPDVLSIGVALLDVVSRVPPHPRPRDSRLDEQYRVCARGRSSCGTAAESESRVESRNESQRNTQTRPPLGRYRARWAGYAADRGHIGSRAICFACCRPLAFDFITFS